MEQLYKNENIYAVYFTEFLLNFYVNLWKAVYKQMIANNKSKNIN